MMSAPHRSARKRKQRAGTYTDAIHALSPMLDTVRRSDRRTVTTVVVVDGKVESTYVESIDIERKEKRGTTTSGAPKKQCACGCKKRTRRRDLTGAPLVFGHAY